MMMKKPMLVKEYPPTLTGLSNLVLAENHKRQRERGDASTNTEVQGDGTDKKEYLDMLMSMIDRTPYRLHFPPLRSGNL